MDTLLESIDLFLLDEDRKIKTPKTSEDYAILLSKIKSLKPKRDLCVNLTGWKMIPYILSASSMRSDISLFSYYRGGTHITKQFTTTYKRKYKITIDVYSERITFNKLHPCIKVFNDSELANYRTYTYWCKYKVCTVDNPFDPLFINDDYPINIRQYPGNVQTDSKAKSFQNYEKGNAMYIEKVALPSIKKSLNEYIDKIQKGDLNIDEIAYQLYKEVDKLKKPTGCGKVGLATVENNESIYILYDTPRALRHDDEYDEYYNNSSSAQQKKMDKVASEWHNFDKLVFKIINKFDKKYKNVSFEIASDVHPSKKLIQPTDSWF